MSAHGQTQHNTNSMKTHKYAAHMPCDPGVVRLNVIRHVTEEFVVIADVDMGIYYRDGQWPQGVILAGKLFTPDQLTQYGLARDEIIYCQ